MKGFPRKGLWEAGNESRVVRVELDVKKQSVRGGSLGQMLPENAQTGNQTREGLSLSGGGAAVVGTPKR